LPIHSIPRATYCLSFFRQDHRLHAPRNTLARSPPPLQLSFVSYNIPLQNYFRLQQNYSTPNFTRSPTYAFPNSHFRRPRNIAPPPSDKNIGTIRSKIVDHPRVIERGVWGFEKKGHVAGCDLDHERRLRPNDDLDHRFYHFQRHGLNEFHRPFRRRE
ncbi:hypothetical protein BDM02DRAFT_3115416, partial [Thelephora ganbajun]